MCDLRSRNKMIFSGFSSKEIEKMKRLVMESSEPLTKDHYKRIAIGFSRSAARAGKPVVKWTEVERWFQRNNDLTMSSPSGYYANNNVLSEMDPSTQPKEDFSDVTKLEFEARSSGDGAWYSIDKFLSHRYLPSGEAEVLVRLVGMEDEWVAVSDAVRKRSIDLRNTDCQHVNVGDLVCCLKETGDSSMYYDANILEIQRRMHDIRGCRCLFLVRYQHNQCEERVRSRKLRRRAT